MYVLLTRHPNWRQLRIHESSAEMRGASAKLAAEYCEYMPSHFDPSTPWGSWDESQRYRSEDLEQQTCDDRQFDVVITQDVFEHIFDTRRAFAEVQRPLKRGGTHILTTPIVRGSQPSRPRAHRSEREIAHLLTAEYHGNSMSSSGSLVTWDWGNDIADFIRDCTGHRVERISIESHAMGIAAEFLDVLVVTRLGEPDLPRGAENNSRTNGYVTSNFAAGNVNICVR
jgi:hypothetical protein